MTGTRPRESAVDRIRERVEENFAIFDFELTDDDRECIAALPKDVRMVDAPWGPDWSD